MRARARGATRVAAPNDESDGERDECGDSSGEFSGYLHANA